MRGRRARLRGRADQHRPGRGRATGRSGAASPTRATRTWPRSPRSTSWSGRRWPGQPEPARRGDAARAPRSGRFLLLHKELDADDQEITRTRKVRRGFVAEKYAPLIEALYGGADHVNVEAQVTYEDGRTGTVRAAVRIARGRDLLGAARGRRDEGAGRAAAHAAPRGRRDQRALRGGAGPRAGEPRDRARGDRRHHRPQRGGQDHAAQRDQRLLPPLRGRRSASRARTGPSSGPTTWPRSGSPAPSRTWRSSRA